MEWKCNCSHNGRISYSIWQKRAGLKFAEVISKLSLLNFYSTDQRAFYYTKCCLQEQKRLSSTTNETCCPLDLSLKFQHRVVTLKRHFPKVGLSWWRYYLGKGYEVSSSHVTWKSSHRLQISATSIYGLSFSEISQEAEKLCGRGMAPSARAVAQALFLLESNVKMLKRWAPTILLVGSRLTFIPAHSLPCIHLTSSDTASFLKCFQLLWL